MPHDPVVPIGIWNGGSVSGCCGALNSTAGVVSFICEVIECRLVPVLTRPLILRGFDWTLDGWAMARPYGDAVRLLIHSTNHVS